ncbi:endonuclease reverse transcriptase [Colletotrichum higginsianum]|nr:endonuclease reverse transcriptase [Colletotrichum higginsianum]
MADNVPIWINPLIHPSARDQLTASSHRDAGTIQISTVGTSPKPTTKVRLGEQFNRHQDNAKLKNEINTVSNLVQDLLRRDAEREQFI